MSNNVGIDFTELGPPHGSVQKNIPTSTDQVSATNPNEKDELITIGFRVKPKEKAIIQDYVNRMHSQYIIDPTTKQPKRMLDSPSIGLMIKIATYSYMTQFNWFMQAMEVQQQQQQQQYQQQRSQVPPNGPGLGQGYGRQPQR